MSSGIKGKENSMFYNKIIEDNPFFCLLLQNDQNNFFKYLCQWLTEKE